MDIAVYTDADVHIGTARASQIRYREQSADIRAASHLAPTGTCARI